jgi:hypothetical protein
MSHDIDSPYAPSKTILVDFDGTICPFSWPELPGAPYPGAVETINKWYDQGYRIVIFTARAWAGWDRINGSREAAVRQVEEWARNYGLRYHEISNEKRPAIMIVDDSAAHCWGASFWQKYEGNADDCLVYHLKGSHMNLSASRELEEKQNGNR